MNDEDDDHDVAVGDHAADDMTPESAFNSPRFRSSLDVRCLLENPAPEPLNPTP